jgi:hypothetical protein
MKHSNRVPCLLLVVGAVAAAAPRARAAQGATGSYSGWYRSDGARSPVAGMDYSTGDLPDDAGTTRGMFLFDLSFFNFGSERVTFASVTLQTFTVQTGDPSETVALYDVSAPRSTLMADAASGSAVGLAVFEDLGTGVAYGQRTYTPADSRSTRVIELNDAAIAAIQALLDRPAPRDFAIGAAVTTLDGADNAEVVYRAGTGPLSPTLSIRTAPVPEPGLGLALPVCAAALLARRRVRTRA